MQNFVFRARRSIMLQERMKKAELTSPAFLLLKTLFITF
jgi:hypothetical protein